MISELDESIRQLLIKEGGFDPSEIEVSFEIPSREWSAGISRPTLNCYLFDIRENQQLRQHGLQTDKPSNANASRVRPRMYFDLTYLVTAWTREVEDEHRLLWHALRTMLRFNAMPVEHLQGVLREQELPLYTRTAMSDGVLKSPGEFWTALENQLKPSISYVVTMAVDRDTLPAGPPVLMSRLRLKGPDQVANDRFVWFGGVVRDESERAIGGANVEIEQHGLQTRTDSNGRFRLRAPAPGRYTLVIQYADVIQRREIEIPETRYDITLRRT
jgi:hypothetical protein